MSLLLLPSEHHILYFRRDRQECGVLAHFHQAPIVLDGETWPTVEHHYQAQKSFDPAYRQAIREAVSPGLAKRLAAPPQACLRVAKQSWFRQPSAMPRPDWHEVKLDSMRRADLVKFSQHRPVYAKPTFVYESA